MLVIIVAIALLLNLTIVLIALYFRDWIWVALYGCTFVLMLGGIVKHLTGM